MASKQPFGAGTFEALIVVGLFAAVLAATAYYLRSVLPKLQAQAKLNFQLEVGAMNKAKLGLTVGSPRPPSTDPRDWLIGNSSLPVIGPRSWFSFPYTPDGENIPNFEDELNGLIGILSASTPRTESDTRHWCVALIDPFLDLLDNECAISEKHLLPGGDALSPNGQCNIGPSLPCLRRRSQWILQRYGCVSANNAGERPLLVGLYPTQDGMESLSATDACVVREVSSEWTWDVRDP